MIQLNVNQNKYIPSFQGRNLVIKEAESYVEKLRVNRKIEKAINKEFYENCQRDFPRWVRIASEKLENFFNLITTPFFDIKNFDVHAIYDENKKILGGFMGKKFMRQYHIGGLFIDKELRRTKDSMQALGLMMEKIKELANQKKLPLITCDAYREARSTISLYRKVGFKESKVGKFINDSLITLDLEVPTKDLGRGIDFFKYKKNK